MKIDLKIVFLVFVVLCLASDIEGWWSRRGSRRSSSRSPSTSSRSSGGGFRRSSSSSRVRTRVSRSRSSTRRWLARRSSSSPRKRTGSAGSTISYPARSGWLARRSSSSPKKRTGNAGSTILYPASFRRPSWSSSSSSSGVSSSGSKKHPDNIKTKSVKTKSERTELFDKKVVSAQVVERPLKFNGGKLPKSVVKIANESGIKTSMSGQKGRATHSGVLVTTSDGKKYLIEKGRKVRLFKRSGTVVTDLKDMGGNWKTVGPAKNVGGKATVGDYVRVGGKYYNWLSDNCHDATDRMKTLGRRKRSFFG